MSHSLNLLQYEVLLEPDQNYPLYITAKKYWLPEFEAHWHDDEAITLIVLHSTSFHKETWQPTLERIFQRASSRFSSKTVNIKCAWAIDCPNHGVSAGLNEEALRQAPFHRTCELTFVTRPLPRISTLSQLDAANMQRPSIGSCLLDCGSHQCSTFEVNVLSV